MRTVLARLKRNTDIFPRFAVQVEFRGSTGYHVFPRKIAPFVSMRRCILHPTFSTVLHTSEKRLQPKPKSLRFFVDVVKKVECNFRIPQFISPQKIRKSAKLRTLPVYNTLLTQSPFLGTFRSDLKEWAFFRVTFRQKVRRKNNLELFLDFSFFLLEFYGGAGLCLLRTTVRVRPCSHG